MANLQIAVETLTLAPVEDGGGGFSPIALGAKLRAALDGA
jgi:hypothetical protein